MEFSFQHRTPAPSASTVNVYNNQSIGDGYACDMTGYISLFGGISGANIFNNIAYASDASNCPEAVVRFNNGSNPSSNVTFVNNTVLSASSCVGLKTDTLTNLVSENNIFQGNVTPIYQDPPNNTSYTTSNYNDFYNFTSIASNNNGPGPPNTYNTLANWQAATIAGGVHPDLNSITTNPLLQTSSPFYINSGSPASGLGTNLTSLGIAALNEDAPYTFGTGYACGGGCTARPGSGAWPAGAYQVPSSPPPSIPSAPAPQMFVWNGTLKEPITLSLSGSNAIPASVAASANFKVKCTCTVPSSGKISCVCQ